MTELKTPVELLSCLDEQLFSAFEQSEQLNEDWLSARLQERAQLLHDVIEQGQLPDAMAAELIRRSRRLKETAESVQRELAERLKKMQKGRRSVQAYQTIKRS